MYRLISQLINPGIVASSDGNYLLAHPINNRPDSLWWLSNGLQCIRDFDQRAASRTIQPGIGEPNRALTVPEVGFVGNYLWSRSATDSSISRYRLRANRQMQVTLPKRISSLLGYSPISNYGGYSAWWVAQMRRNSGNLVPTNGISYKNCR